MAKRSAGSYLLKVSNSCRNISTMETRNAKKNLQLPRSFFYFYFQLVEQWHFCGLCLGLLLTIWWFTQRLRFAVWRLRSEIYVKCIIDISTARLSSGRICKNGFYVEKCSLMLWMYNARISLTCVSTSFDIIFETTWLHEQQLRERLINIQLILYVQLININ